MVYMGYKKKVLITGKRWKIYPSLYFSVVIHHKKGEQAFIHKNYCCKIFTEQFEGK